MDFLISFEISWRQAYKVGTWIEWKITIMKTAIFMKQITQDFLFGKIFGQNILKQILKIKNSHLEITIIPFKNIIKFPYLFLGKSITDFLFPDMNLHTWIAIVNREVLLINMCIAQGNHAVFVVNIKALYMSSSLWLLGVESHDFFSCWEKKKCLQSWSNSQNGNYLHSKWA